MNISILGVEFHIKLLEAKLLDYVHAFMDAYADGEEDITPTKHIAIDVEHGPIIASPPYKTVAVHLSKHSYWNFDGLLQPLPKGGCRVIWNSKGIAITLDKGVKAVKVMVDPGIDSIRAGETVFHLCRSLALYQRDGHKGNLLHASAIEFNQAAILFCGGTCSGKTTLLTEAVFHSNACPLANDRVLITSDAHPIAVSWPSYASFCEGTLLKYPSLKRAAMKYERDSCLYRTQSWPGHLQNVFTKEVKRIYPMIWFSQATGKKFVRQRPLRALVLTQVSPSMENPGLELLGLTGTEKRRRLASLLHPYVFEQREEPSFMPWHGLPFPQGVPSLDDLVHRFDSVDVPIFFLRARADDLSPLYELLSEVNN